MNDSKPWLIPTSDLPLGISLQFDLFGADGQLLQRAGEVLDERFQRRLRDMGVESIRLCEAGESDSQKSDTILRTSFPQVTIQRLQSTIDNIRSSLSGLLKSLHEPNATHVENLRTSVGEFVSQAKKDTGASLAVVALNSKPVSRRLAEHLANHSANLSLLSVVMSVAQRDEPMKTQHIGMAALLHDSWLLNNPEWFESILDSRDEAARKRYRWHPIESSDLLNGLTGVPDTVLQMISEVHEQADGTGYPRAIPMDRVHPGSKILNLADAYLNLVNPIEGIGFVSADAIAYLCFHANKGKFCVDTVRLLTKCLSMYPVGTTVELDDQSKAVVTKGNTQAPLSPIVRLLHGDNDELDLRTSDRFIASPWLSAEEKSERLVKSRFLELLWRIDR